MLEKFYPGEYLDSTYVIDFDRLYEEGYRGVIFDIDNTLSYLDDVVQRANLYLFDYIKVHYPKIILQSPNE